MNQHRFDHLTRSLTSGASRRHLVVRLAGGAFALSTARLPPIASARKKRKKRKKKQKVTFNDFGCVNVSGPCTSNDQCCSGICEGQKEKRTCRGHDAGACQSNQDSCLDTLIPCTTPADEVGYCTITTGAAPYCAGATRCFPCTKDADCVPHCGSRAGCIACADCLAINGEETACVGPSGTSCTIPK